MIKLRLHKGCNELRISVLTNHHYEDLKRNILLCIVFMKQVDSNPIWPCVCTLIMLKGWMSKPDKNIDQ